MRRAAPRFPKQSQGAARGDSSLNQMMRGRDQCPAWALDPSPVGATPTRSTLTIRS